MWFLVRHEPCLHHLKPYLQKILSSPSLCTALSHQWPYFPSLPFSSLLPRPLSPPTTSFSTSSSPRPPISYPFSRPTWPFRRSVGAFRVCSRSTFHPSPLIFYGKWLILPKALISNYNINYMSDFQFQQWLYLRVINSMCLKNIYINHNVDE